MFRPFKQSSSGLLTDRVNRFCVHFGIPVCLYMQFVPFWVIPRRLSSNCRRFGTHCRFHLHRQVNEIYTSFTCLWRRNRQWVPKRRQLELRCRGITQKEQITFRTRRKLKNKNFYTYWIQTCTQHLLTRSVRRPDDNRLKSSKHVASYTIK